MKLRFALPTVLAVFVLMGCDESLVNGNADENEAAAVHARTLSPYNDGRCAYNCAWGEGDCVWNQGGSVTTGSCGSNQVCCDVGEPARPQCGGTCVMQWQACPAGSAVTDGNCSDLQQKCCSTGTTDTGVAPQPDTGVAPQPDTGVAPQPDTGVDTGTASGSVVISMASDWGAGYCANVDVRGLQNWTVVIDIHQSGINNLWNGSYKVSGSLVTVSGTQTSFGFCANTTGSNYVPTLVSAKGDGGVVDTGSNDTGVDTGVDTGNDTGVDSGSGSTDLTPGDKWGWASRYWDCCKPHCAWSANANPPMKTCDINNQPLWNANATSGCDGGSAYTCFDMAPWAVSDQLSYGFAAVPATGDVCGRCYQLNFSGGGQHDNNPGAQALSSKGKVMIVQATNVGWDVGSSQFDLLIPGGGVGAFNGCAKQWGTTDLGAQYGGFLTECQSQSSNWITVKSCVYNKCQQVFGNKADLMKGCDWFVNWFEAANNPRLLYKEVPCPAALRNVSGMN